MNLSNISLARAAATLLAVGAVGAACGSTTSTPTTNSDPEETTSETSSQSEGSNEPTSSGDEATRNGVEAAQWADNVTITYGDDTFTYASDGMPSHELPDQFLIPGENNMPPFEEGEEFEIANTDELVAESPISEEITLNPVYSETTTDTSLGLVGVTISGAPLFNDYEDQGREYVALDDNISVDSVYFIDPCNGHPLADGTQYHYHGVPYCVTDDVDIDGEHSTILGFLVDGFPLYGPQDADGATITSADLDECSGHVGPTPEFPDGIYHYHLTEDMAPYSIDCYHGEVPESMSNTGAPGGGGQGPPNGEGPPGGEGPPNGEGPPDGEGPPQLGS